MTALFTRFLYPAVATPNTTRIAAVDDIGTAVALSRFGWLHGSNAVILAPVNQPALDAAASTLVHFPIDAPILLNPVATLDPRVAAEIQRLMPAGVDAPAQVLLVGPFTPAVATAIQALGFTTAFIGSADPISTAVATATLRRAVEPGVRNVTLISLDDLVWGLPATAWAAHFGDSVLFVFFPIASRPPRHVSLDLSTQSLFDGSASGH